MSIVVHPGSRADQWMTELRRHLPEEDLRPWPDIGDPAEVEYLIAWVMSRRDLATFTGLRAILCMGAGVEQWQKPGIDTDVVRLADPAMADEMAAYTLTWVVGHARRLADHAAAARSDRQWKPLETKSTAEFRVGVLGFGEIGSRVAEAFLAFGYPVNAWTRTGGDDDRVTHYAGLDELDAFLGRSDAVINVLPSTPDTTGLLTAERFARFARGSLFVNIGRGTVVADETDLVAALDDGPLGAAVLDVTNPEPPAEDSPLWTHEAVTLTPHISGRTQIPTAAATIAANIRRLRRGDQPFPLLDRERGY